MSVAHTPSKLIAYGLLIASLALPSAVFAGEPDKSNGELAPGFNICEKHAADSAKSSSEYKKLLLGCLDSAGKYWDEKIYIQSGYYLSTYKDTLKYDEIKQVVPKFHIAWIKYKKAGSELIKSDGDQQNIKTRYFEVQDTQRQAKLLANDFSLEIEEELAPGYDMCNKEAADASDGSMPSLREARDREGCDELAGKYWPTIFEKRYEIYMNLYKDDPEKQKKLQNFRKAWERYVDAGCDFIGAQGGSGSFAISRCFYFRIEEARRMARLLDVTRVRW